MPLTRVASIVAACLLAANALADAPPHFDKPLTLVELTDLALRNNPSTKIAWGEIRESQAGVELARAGYWPQFTLDYGITRENTTTATGAPGPYETDSGPSLSLNYLLWDFGARSGSVDAAKFALTAAELGSDQTMQDVILAVEQDYYQVLGLQALQDADTQSVQDASASLDAANQRKNSGLATIGDVYQAQAAYAGAELTLQTTAGQLALSRGQLAVAVGYPADTALPLAELLKQVDAKMPTENVHDLMQQAEGARPELLAAKAQEQSTVATLESTEGQGWPSLVLSGSAGRTTTEIAGQKNGADAYSAGLTLSFPLFTGFANQAANRKAEAAVDVASATTQQTLQQVQLDVWQAYQNLHTVVTTLDTAEVQLKSAQQALDVANARYKGGLDTIIDVLTAQATLANARVQEVQARLNWFGGLAALGHAVGGLAAPKTDDMEMP
jgi:TolC family type I secretion outer membrane protein